MSHKFRSYYLNRESIFSYKDKLLFGARKLWEIVEKIRQHELHNKDFGSSHVLISWQNKNILLYINSNISLFFKNIIWVNKHEWRKKINTWPFEWTIWYKRRNISSIESLNLLCLNYWATRNTSVFSSVKLKCWIITFLRFFIVSLFYNLIICGFSLSTCPLLFY